jgi:hypothetical protein
MEFDIMLIRDSIYSLNEVLKHVQFIPKNSGPNSGIKSGKKNKIEFNGHLVNMASDRYKLFATKGVACVECGIEGSMFALEKYENAIGYHFNLYAVDDVGNEILMTKDHIIPKSLGGPNNLSNYQTMCIHCNSNKGVGGLTLDQWKGRPWNTLKVGAIEHILADWEQRERYFIAEIKRLRAIIGD